jgi:glycosyltransferase involved in cell wall biosynthesis
MTGISVGAPVDILVDVRCLQDEAYRRRGVGRLSANVLSFARSMLLGSVRLIGIVDPSLPPLAQLERDLLDAIRPTAYTGKLTRPTWFVQLSPMTHDPLFVARLLHHPSVFKATIVYDFIPLEYTDQYLPTPARRIDYRVAMYWLGRHDVFLPISRSTADQLKSLLRIAEDDLTVIGAPLDPIFEGTATSDPGQRARTYILVVGGADPRKNVECAIRAHGRSRQLQSMGIGLTVTGTYPEDCLTSLRSLHAQVGGRSHLLRFPGYVEEQLLVDLYRGAACVVCPSRAEGFSLPIVEAMAMGAPVIASAIPAHAELIERCDLLPTPDDDAAVRQLLERIVTDLAFRDSIVAAQRGAWPHFRGQEVARRFWSSIAKQADRRSLRPPAVIIGTGRRPQVAVLTPLPPDRSGVASYTAASLKEIARHVDLHVFTETTDPSLVVGPITVQPLSPLPHLSSRFDRVVSVMGNSHFHTSIFRHILRYGGACIEHDNRLLAFYRTLLGEARCRHQAEKELGRPLASGELERWLADESTMETPFLGEIIEVAEPLFLHSKVTARLVEERYGVRPEHLPFCVYHEHLPDALTPQARAAARRRLEIPSDTIAIAVFGFVHPTKAPDECIWALEMLRVWGYAARLWFVGEVLEGAPGLRRLAESIEVADDVVFTGEYVDDTTYSDFLLAADVAIQLRTHRLGGLSGALLDCIAAGLPAVANDDLAEAMEVPAYVRRVPDQPSPVLIAEALANLIDEAGQCRLRWEEQRLTYIAEHSFGRYAERLVAGLGFDRRAGS